MPVGSLVSNLCFETLTIVCKNCRLTRTLSGAMMRRNSNSELGIQHLYIIDQNALTLTFRALTKLLRLHIAPSFLCWYLRYQHGQWERSGHHHQPHHHYQHFKLSTHITIIHADLPFPPRLPQFHGKHVQLLHIPQWRIRHEKRLNQTSATPSPPPVNNIEIEPRNQWQRLKLHNY